jgi:hypothetical protein
VDQAIEIMALRQGEAVMQQQSVEADRLCRRLVDTYRCDFVIVEGIAFQRWAPLPYDWQNGVAEPVVSRFGKPPRHLKGPVAVSLATLKWIGGYVF